MSGIDIETAWPAILLALRVGALVVLYLFLFAAFRALRADLRAAPVATEQRTATTPTVEDRVPQDATDLPPLDDDEGVADEEPADFSADRAPSPAAQRRTVPMPIAIPSAAVALVLVLGSIAALVAREPASERAEAPASESAPFGPPTVTPALGRVSVGLAATEDSQVRVTVDGVVQFDGTLRARERQSWEGSERIQIWTDKGRTLHLSVNGNDLGPYSPAMGHPDWNRIDFGFWPGWTR